MPRGKSVTSGDGVTQLDQLYYDYWEFILREYPLNATYLGDHRYDSALEDASEEAFNRRVAQSKKYLDRLRSIEKPSTADENIPESNSFTEDLMLSIGQPRDRQNIEEVWRHPGRQRRLTQG